jgi:hypothetical protein
MMVSSLELLHVGPFRFVLKDARVSRWVGPQFDFPCILPLASKRKQDILAQMSAMEEFLRWVAPSPPQTPTVSLVGYVVGGVFGVIIATILAGLLKDLYSACFT